MRGGLLSVCRLGEEGLSGGTGTVTRRVDGAGIDRAAGLAVGGVCVVSEDLGLWRFLILVATCGGPYTVLVLLLERVGVETGRAPSGPCYAK